MWAEAWYWDSATMAVEGLCWSLIVGLMSAGPWSGSLRIPVSVRLGRSWSDVESSIGACETDECPYTGTELICPVDVSTDDVDSWVYSS